MPEAWNAHLQGGVGGLNRSAGGHCTTESSIAERTSSRASQHFRERVRQLERRWDTYKFCEFPEVVLAHEHVAQVEVLDAIVAAIVARQFLASFVVFVNDSGATPSCPINCDFPRWQRCGQKLKARALVKRSSCISHWSQVGQVHGRQGRRGR